MVKLTDAHFRALRWGLVGLCWQVRKGSFDAGIRRNTVMKLEKAGLLHQDGIFYRITDLGRQILSEGEIRG